MTGERNLRRYLGGVLLLMGATLPMLLSLAQPARSVWIAEIRGTIDPGTSNYLESVITRASDAGATAVIVELDTPGGLVSSVQEMAQAIDRSKVPVIVYVTPAGSSATSAGALLALASHVAAMAPGSHIGAAHPVDTSGKEVPGAMGEKIVNDVSAFARGLAEVRGRDPELAEAIVRKSRSFTAQEALKKSLVEIVAPSRADLLNALDGREVKLGAGPNAGLRKLQTRGAETLVIEMSWGQKLLHLLANPNIATILMTLGMLLIYVEVSNPGITIAGVLGVICLLIAFIAFQTLPIRSGALVLIVLGSVLIIAEVFVASGGALAAGGSLAFVLGLLWIMDPEKSNLTISPAVWVPSALAMVGGAAALGWAANRMRRLTRETRERIGGLGHQGLAGYEGRVEVIDPDGKRGKASIRGEIWNIESLETLKRGDRIRVVKVDGFKVYVTSWSKEES